MRLVVGIGNPGTEYAGTRHNVGFEILDLVGAALGARFERAGGGDLLARARVSGEDSRLLKPGTYVNKTGAAIARLRTEVELDPMRVLVVLDDLALPPGRLRLRASGGDGGHGGLRSVIAELGTEAVPRLRVGIGSVPAEVWREYVLSPFFPEEREVMAQALARARDAVMSFLEGNDLAAIASEVNRSPPGNPEPGTGGSGGRGEGRAEPPDQGERED